MLKTRFLLALCAALFSLYAFAAEGRRPLVSTTIDYLDYVFYDKEGPADVYPLEVWEKRMKEMADYGIRKVYLRVNVCGVTLWPSKVSAQYQGGEHFDSPVESARLGNTLRTYDPLAETIRIGHKYGMEVWCWDSIWDDAASYHDAEAFPEGVAKFGNFPLLDTWHKTHPGFWSRRNPKDDPAPRDPAVVDVAKRPVAKIVLVSEIKSPSKIRFTPEMLSLYVGEKNGKFRPYEGKYDLKIDLTPDGRQRVTVTGLKITVPYVKFWHDTLPNGGGYGFVGGSYVARDCHIYDADGRELPVTWGYQIPRNPVPPETTRLVMEPLARFAWDSGNYQFGFRAGRSPDADPAKWLAGVPELLLPAVQDHKVDRFRELAAYPFDGFVYNIRSHSRPLANNPDNYGFNPELRDLFLKRTGQDIYTDDYDRDKFNDMRSEGIDAFLKRCKAAAGGRPLYMTIGDPRKGSGSSSAAGWVQKLGFRWHPDKWFQEGSVDGITMLGDFFPEALVGKKSNGKPVKIVVFREMAYHPAGYDLKTDLEQLAADGRIDEVELYETLAIKPARRAVISNFVNGK